MRIKRSLLRAVMVALVGLFTGLYGGHALAYVSGTYGSGAYGMCDYGTICSVTVSTSGTINLNVTPTSSGKCTYDSDTVSVLTDDSNGYTLTLTNTSTNTSLLSGAHSIAASGGTFAAPATLTGASWGYRLDGVGSFGSGPTTAQSNVAPTGLLFAGLVASSASPDVLANTSTAADPAVNTTVWYGVCANTSVTSGSYTAQATYTAVAN